MANSLQNVIFNIQNIIENEDVTQNEVRILLKILCDWWNKCEYNEQPTYTASTKVDNQTPYLRRLASECKRLHSQFVKIEKQTQDLDNETIVIIKLTQLILENVINQCENITLGDDDTYSFNNRNRTPQLNKPNKVDFDQLSLRTDGLREISRPYKKVVKNKQRYNKRKTKQSSPFPVSDSDVDSFRKRSLKSDELYNTSSELSCKSSDSEDNKNERQTRQSKIKSRKRKKSADKNKRCETACKNTVQLSDNEKINLRDEKNQQCVSIKIPSASAKLGHKIAQKMIDTFMMNTNKITPEPKKVYLQNVCTEAVDFLNAKFDMEKRKASLLSRIIRYGSTKATNTAQNTNQIAGDLPEERFERDEKKIEAENDTELNKVCDDLKCERVSLTQQHIKHSLENKSSSTTDLQIECDRTKDFQEKKVECANDIELKPVLNELKSELMSFIKQHIKSTVENKSSSTTDLPVGRDKPISSQESERNKISEESKVKNNCVVPSEKTVESDNIAKIPSAQKSLENVDNEKNRKSSTDNMDYIYNQRVEPERQISITISDCGGRCEKMVSTASLEDVYPPLRGPSNSVDKSREASLSSMLTKSITSPISAAALKEMKFDGEIILTFSQLSKVVNDVMAGLQPDKPKNFYRKEKSTSIDSNIIPRIFPLKNLSDSSCSCSTCSSYSSSPSHSQTNISNKPSNVLSACIEASEAKEVTDAKLSVADDDNNKLSIAGGPSHAETDAIFPKIEISVERILVTPSTESAITVPSNNSSLVSDNGDSEKQSSSAQKVDPKDFQEMKTAIGDLNTNVNWIISKMKDTDEETKSSKKTSVATGHDSDTKKTVHIKTRSCSDFDDTREQDVKDSSDTLDMVAKMPLHEDESIDKPIVQNLKRDSALSYSASIKDSILNQRRRSSLSAKIGRDSFSTNKKTNTPMRSRVNELKAEYTHDANEDEDTVSDSSIQSVTLDDIESRKNTNLGSSRAYLESENKTNFNYRKYSAPMSRHLREQIDELHKRKMKINDSKEKQNNNSNDNSQLDRNDTASLFVRASVEDLFGSTAAGLCPSDCSYVDMEAIPNKAKVEHAIDDDFEMDLTTNKPVRQIETEAEPNQTPGICEPIVTITNDAACENLTETEDKSLENATPITSINKLQNEPERLTISIPNNNTQDTAQGSTSNTELPKQTTSTPCTSNAQGQTKTISLKNRVKEFYRHIKFTKHTT